MEISKEGIDLIKKYEGLRLQAYRCPAGVWTIGWGHTQGVYEGMTITTSKADELLRNDLRKYEAYVNNKSYVPISLNQCQFDALVSFCYNCGAGSLKTLCKGRNSEEIAKAMPLYNKGGGKVLAGLVRRRAEEVALFNKGSDKMVINIHAGHNADGRNACGAIGYIKESTEARKVVNKVVIALSNMGHTVYDCTVDNAANQNENLRQIVDKCNTHKADLDISVHFNAGVNEKAENGSTTGTEVYVYSNTSKAKATAERVVNEISKLGFKNRGVKIGNKLYVLRNTASPAMLIECCFVDDKDDCNIYNADKMANAIVKGITGQDIKPAVKHDEVPFLVRIKCEALNIRAGAGTEYSIVGSVVKDQVFTIVETNGKWGLLKSGKGWISISDLYVTKLKTE